MTSYSFSERGTTQAVEEGRALSPKFDADGLVTCVATDAANGVSPKLAGRLVNS